MARFSKIMTEDEVNRWMQQVQASGKNTSIAVGGADGLRLFHRPGRFFWSVMISWRGKTKIRNLGPFDRLPLSEARKAAIPIASDLLTELQLEEEGLDATETVPVSQPDTVPEEIEEEPEVDEPEEIEEEEQEEEEETEDLIEEDWYAQGSFLISINGIANICAISDELAAELVKRDDFPAPVWLFSNVRRWPRFKVMDWIADQSQKEAE